MPARILVVEDESDLAWLERFNLEDEGYEVEVAGEGGEALSALDRFDPDVLVLDVMLPHVDGWSVLDVMGKRSTPRRPRVILVSAVAGVEDRCRRENLEVSSVLAKPFEMEELVRLVRDALAS